MGAARHRLAALAATLLLAACAGPRPIHPYRLQGFPGAPIEPDLFPVRAGAEWIFEDESADEGRRLRLAIEAQGDELVLVGSRDGGGATIRVREGFVEIVKDGAVVERPFKLEGRVGDTWRVAKAEYTVFGYDELDVLGEKRRALVVAVERTPVRDLYWFVAGIGWARIRTERFGAVKRDARLVEHKSATTN